MCQYLLETNVWLFGTLKAIVVYAWPSSVVLIIHRMLWVLLSVPQLVNKMHFWLLVVFP